MRDALFWALSEFFLLSSYFSLFQSSLLLYKQVVNSEIRDMESSDNENRPKVRFFFFLRIFIYSNLYYKQVVNYKDATGR